LPYIVTLAILLPDPEAFNVPPAINVTVTAVLEIVPTVHVPDDVIVIDLSTVHVSPGVVNEVGDVLPFVQFESVFIAPALAVVHAVE
jgi:hypothetical protein